MNNGEPLSGEWLTAWEHAMLIGEAKDQKGRRLTDAESMGMLFDDTPEIPDGVIPIVHEYRDTDLTVKQCGNCLAQLFLENQKYCAECGSRIRWDDVT